MIYTINNNSNITNELNNIWSESNKYSYIYTSIGSKFNQENIIFNNSITRKSNALYQMIPQFILDKSEVFNKLIIIFDKFNKKELVNNIKLLNNALIDNNTIDVIIINTYILYNNIYNCIKPILYKLIEYNISPSNFIIANFIIYQFPNNTEHQNSLFVIENINDILTKYNYEDSLYCSFGFSFYLYNYLYRYNKYVKTHLYTIYRLFNIYLKDEYLSSNNIDKLILDHHEQRKIEYFINNSINIIE